MKFGQFSVLTLSSLLLMPGALNAAKVDIQWEEPESFQDIEAGNLGNQKDFQQQVVDELGRHIRSAADMYLDPDQQLNMTVTDIDLAGDVEYFFTRFPQGIRVVRNLHYPSIEFSYELLDSNDVVLMSGEENIRDMGFQYSGNYMVSDAELDYEKRMIDDWFENTFGSGN